ncbi:hypothetical protein HDV04_003781 [Boothiomyces sp. JEL0838]|nr:hypothetical protein HDV04_003781 [Boothiomyces sp. JEL0838]
MYNIEVAKNESGVVENLQQRTILITNLTPELSSKSKLTKWFEDLDIGEISEINMNTSQDYQLLQKLHQHNKLLRKLESAYMYWAIQIYKSVEKDRRWDRWTKLSPQKLIDIHETPMSDLYKEKAAKKRYTCRPLFYEAAEGTIKRYDVINSLTYKINILESEIDNLRNQTTQLGQQMESRSNSNLSATLNRIYKDLEKYSVSAFVTFKDRKSAIMARQLLLHSALDTTTMLVTQAPVPNDVIWDSLSRTLFDRLIKRNAVLLLVWCWIYPFQILMFLIVISYAVISPLVLLPGVVYFAFAYVVYKNQLMYVYIKPVEGQGKYWKMAFDRSVVGIGLFQFLSAGILSAKQAAYPSILVGILIPITVHFHSICERSFGKQNLIPLELLVKPPESVEEKLENTDSIQNSSPIQVQVENTQPVDEIDPQIQVLQIKSPTTPLFPSKDLAAIQAKSDDYRSPSKSLKLTRLWIPEYISHLINADEPDNLANVEENQLSITDMNWTSIQNLRP